MSAINPRDWLPAIEVTSRLLDALLRKNFHKLYMSVCVCVSLLTNQNSINKEIKCRLEAGNSCYYSVHTP